MFVEDGLESLCPESGLRQESRWWIERGLRQLERERELLCDC